MWEGGEAESSSLYAVLLGGKLRKTMGKKSGLLAVNNEYSSQQFPFVAPRNKQRLMKTIPVHFPSL